MGKSTILCGGLSPCIQRTLELGSVALGQVNRVQKVTETVGGKQINTARLVQALGGAARTIGFSGGENGRKMMKLLVAEGLYMESVPAVGTTRICQTLIDHTTQDVTELVEELPPVSVAEQQLFMQRFMELRADAALITLSGTIPAGFPSDFYRTLLEGVKVPVLIDSHGPALKAALSSSPLMVKLNEYELAATCEAGSIEESAHQLLTSGVEWVLVTRGASGALLLHKNGKWVFGVPEVRVLNPIGSGDAVTAGIAFALSQARPMPAAVRFGLACGAAQTESLVSGVFDPVRARALEGLVPFERGAFFSIIPTK